MNADVAGLLDRQAITEVLHLLYATLARVRAGALTEFPDARESECTNR